MHPVKHPDMNQTDGDADDVEGLPVDEAVGVVDDESRDTEDVRTVLGSVAEDGVVSRDGLDDAIVEASEVLATAETRAELAAEAFSHVEEIADPVSDLGVVQSRLDAHAAKLDGVEHRIDEAGSDLESIVERSSDPDAFYDVAVDAFDLTTRATETQRFADELQMELEEFEQWLGSSETRFREFEADLDALEDTFEDLTTVLVDIEIRAARAPPPEDGQTVVVPDDVVAAWADSTFRQRVLGLFVDDLRAELADLREWADRDGEDVEARASGVEARIEEFDEQVADTGDRLDTVGRPTWRDRFGEELASFESELDSFESPVPWDDVRSTLESHVADVRSEVE